MEYIILRGALEVYFDYSEMEFSDFGAEFDHALEMAREAFKKKVSTNSQETVPNFSSQI